MDVKETAQSVTGSIVGMTPLGKISKLVGKIAAAVTVAIVILLIIISIVLFSNGSVSAGVWVLGAGVAIGSFYIYTSRDLCANSSRILGMGESDDSERIDSAPIEKLNEITDLTDLSPEDWQEFDKVN